MKFKSLTHLVLKQSNLKIMTDSDMTVLLLCAHLKNVLFETILEMSSKLKVKDIISYFDEGGNVIVVGDIDTSVSFRKLFFSFGINLD